MRYYRNAACWHSDIQECWEREDCDNAEVTRIHNVLSEPATTLAQYVADWEYSLRDGLDFEEVISNSLMYIGRSTQDPTDDTNNALGMKHNVKARHYVKVNLMTRHSRHHFKLQVRPTSHTYEYRRTGRHTLKLDPLLSSSESLSPARG